jgi:uncharacterized protein (DUF2235 family)
LTVPLETVKDGVRQIACYNNGFGTSAFRPVALLGGAFGYGLKRNVLHLYEFLCQNWEEGDEIYIFGSAAARSPHVSRPASLVTWACW